MTTLPSYDGISRVASTRARWFAMLEGRLPRQVGVTLLGLLLAFLSLYPISMLLYGSFHSTPPGVAGAFDLSGYAQVFTWPTVLVFLNTIGISLVKTVIALALAVLFG